MFPRGARLGAAGPLAFLSFSFVLSVWHERDPLTQSSGVRSLKEL